MSWRLGRCSSTSATCRDRSSAWLYSLMVGAHHATQHICSRSYGRKLDLPGTARRGSAWLWRHGGQQYRPHVPSGACARRKQPPRSSQRLGLPACHAVVGLLLDRAGLPARVPSHVQCTGLSVCACALQAARAPLLIPLIRPDQLRSIFLLPTCALLPPACRLILVPMCAVNRGAAAACDTGPRSGPARR